MKNPFEREYLFVLEDVRNQLIIGTSMIIAQHGTYEAPHIYFDVSEREHYSATIERHLRHKVLSIGYNYEGPTEIGGLVVDPPYRATPDKPGKQLSYVRFLFMAMPQAHVPSARARRAAAAAAARRAQPLVGGVRQQVHRPQLPGGRPALPPEQGVHQGAVPLLGHLRVALSRRACRRCSARWGPNTRGVQRMLERIGFRYVERIDPFDGGPHFEANLADVTLVRRFRTVKLAAEDFEHGGG